MPHFHRNNIYFCLLSCLILFCTLKVHSEPTRQVYLKKTDDLLKVLSKEKTRYIIRYHHDLSKYKNTVVIGENSILEFREGSLNNGLIEFNNTKIKSKRRKIFSNNSYKGTIDVETAYP